MLQNATLLKKSAAGPHITCLSHASLVLRLPHEMRLQILVKRPARAIVFETAAKPARLAHFWQGAYPLRRPHATRLQHPWCFLPFWLRNVFRATTICTFSTSQLPKVLWGWSVLYIFTSKRASCHTGLDFFNVAPPKSGPRLRCFWRACTFLTSQHPKVVWTRNGFNIFSSQCKASRNGVRFFNISTSTSAPGLRCLWHFDFETCFAPQRLFLISHLPRWPCTCRFSDPPELQNIGKTKLRDFSTVPFCAPSSSFFWLFLFSDLFFPFFSGCWAVHIGRVWFLNFLDFTHAHTHTHLHTHTHIYIYISLYLSTYLSFYLSIYLSIYLMLAHYKYCVCVFFFSGVFFHNDCWFASPIVPSPSMVATTLLSSDRWGRQYAIHQQCHGSPWPICHHRCGRHGGNHR